MKEKILCFFGFIIIFALWIVFTSGINEEEMIGSIMNGNYKYLDNEEDKMKLSSMNDSGTLEMLEWVCYDANNDGKKDLILQEKAYSPNINLKPIVGILGATGAGITVIEWDVADMAEYYCLCNGRLLFYYGKDGLLGTESFGLFEYDQNWNKKWLGGLEKNWINDTDDIYDMPEEWRRENPDMIQEGIYYRKFQSEEAEETSGRKYTIITEHQWMDEFYQVFGVEYNDIKSSR